MGSVPLLVGPSSIYSLRQFLPEVAIVARSMSRGRIRLQVEQSHCDSLVAAPDISETAVRPAPGGRSCRGFAGLTA